VPELWDPNWQIESTFFVQALTPTPGRKKSVHCACKFEPLRSGLLRTRKKYQISQDIRIRTLFSDSHYSSSNCSRLACKVPGAVRICMGDVSTRVHTNYVHQKSRPTIRPLVGHISPVAAQLRLLCRHPD
jgi:hypothetical protein